MTMTRALFALLTVSLLAHLADRVAIGWHRCHPVHCIGGPKW